MKLSVLMITYNHETYIAQALDSVLMQEVDFDYEIVIGEDCSTDNTRSILLDYQRRFPDKIRLLLPGKNLGMMRNFLETYNACGGDYIAILEGDDYWVSNTKLRKQVEFLDNNDELAICFGKTGTTSEQSNDIATIIPPLQYRKPKQSIVNLIGYNFIPTCSVMFRNYFKNKLPEWFLSLSFGDYPLHIINSQYGYIGYLDELVAVYRMHGQSNFSSRDIVARYNSVVNLYRQLFDHVDDQYRKYIVGAIRLYYYNIASELIGRNDYANAQLALKSCRSVGNYYDYVKSYRIYLLILKCKLANMVKYVCN